MSELNKRLVPLVGNSSWLQKFLAGGVASLAAAPSQEQMMKQLVALVQAARKGDKKALSQIQQIMKAALEGNPEAQEVAQVILQIASEISGQTTMAKCGSKLKKKSGGGYIKSKKDCNCPTKLAKFGTKIVEVDCHGVPIAKKGCKVKKGQIGIPEGINKKYIGAYVSNATAPAAGASNSRVYYDPTTKKYMTQSYDANSKVWGRGTEIGTQARVNGTDTGNINDTHIYFDNASGRLKQQIYGDTGWSEGVDYNTANNDFYAAGFDPTKGIFDSEENAVAALGKDKYDSYVTPGQSWYGFTGKAGNKALGTTGTFTARDLINLTGSVSNALDTIESIESSERKLAREDRKVARKGYMIWDPEWKEVGKQYKTDKEGIKATHTANKRQVLNEGYLGRSYNVPTVPLKPAGKATYATSLPSSNTNPTSGGRKKSQLLGDITTEEQQKGGWLSRFPKNKKK